MRTIADSVRDVVEGSQLLQSGLNDRLLNLSQVARFLAPLIQARLGREVTTSAILMALSRLQREYESMDLPVEGEFFVDRINIQSGLSTLTVVKTPDAHRAMHRFFNRVQESAGYVTFTEGTSEITVIVDSAYAAYLSDAIGAAPKQIQRNIAGLGVTFRSEHTEQPGLLYRLLQQVAMQRINVVEVNSTMTEFTIYVHEKDVRLAFDSLYRVFSKR